MSALVSYIKPGRKSAWIYVWQDRGLIVSKPKLFTAIDDEPAYVMRRINRLLEKPKDYPKATSRVIGRMLL